MNIVVILLKLIGSLAFLLYGMKMMSDGIQKSAGEGLQKALGFMTGNRFMGFLTGLILTMIIQSSGATTVMEVTFVNAGLMTLVQSVGVTLGANIGTTITAWIVALFGFNFSIKNFAIPIFGVGYFMMSAKKFKQKGVGEAIMGFGLLFIGLDWLSETFKNDNGMLNFLQNWGNFGIWSTVLGVIAGALITALIHSSSAETAIVITMANGGLVNWHFAAALVIGSNIGSTIDAVLAAVGTKADAKRCALVHVLFNVFTVILSILFMTPLLKLVDLIIPGTPEENIVLHIAMLHTVIKTIFSVITLPFTRQFAKLTTLLIKDDPVDTSNTYHFEFNEALGKDNASSHVLEVEQQISAMTVHVTTMIEEVSSGFADRTTNFITDNMENLVNQEDYADQMKEQITKYLICCSKLPLSEQQANSLSLMQQIVDDLEEMTDDCYSIAMLLKKSIENDMQFTKDDMDRLSPYIDLARQFMYFIRDNINTHLSEEKLVIAREIEDQIDVFKKNLKKVARKRLEAGADVKAELLYIDLVRQIEKFGDRAYSIAGALSSF